MKKIVVVFLAVFAWFNVMASPVVMPRVDVKLFVNKGLTDFKKGFSQDVVKKKASVEWLFENNQLQHDFSKAVQPDLKFTPYWEHFSENWFLVDLDKDGREELLFSGKPLVSDEKEQFAIYVKYGEVWKEVFWDDGHLLAYKVHPNTGEIILYHHRYPCCSQFTHLIQKVRWVRNKLRFTQRYFIARDSEIKGQLFPEKVNYPNRYRQLKKTKMLYWSKGKIRTNAAIFAKSNAIIHYPSKSYYQRLAKVGKWSYVMMVSPPVLEESRVANAQNLQQARYYGWIED